MTLAASNTPAPKAETNPSNRPEKMTEVRRDNRIPMSLPTMRLQVPEIPGYHLHWMRDDPGRLDQALRAGYVFVEHDEVMLNRVGLANGGMDSGTSDLGSRVSIATGDHHLFLMKLPQEFWEDDQKTAGEKQEQIASTIRGDKGFAEAGLDASNRYVPKDRIKDQARLFTPKATPVGRLP